MAGPVDSDLLPTPLPLPLETRDLPSSRFRFCSSEPPDTVARNREYRILAAWPLVMGWSRTGSLATRFQSILDGSQRSVMERQAGQNEHTSLRFFCFKMANRKRAIALSLLGDMMKGFCFCTATRMCVLVNCQYGLFRETGISWIAIGSKVLFDLGQFFARQVKPQGRDNAEAKCAKSSC